MQYKIEKGIPLPAKGGRTGMMGVLRELEVGESVFVPNQKSSSLSGRFAWLRPKKFTTRSQDGGTRIWRVE
jgi:uncharacterized protein (DUF2249 family)